MCIFVKALNESSILLPVTSTCICSHRIRYVIAVLKGERFLFSSICLIVNANSLTKRLRVTKMKQKYHKKYKTQQMLFSVASSCFTIMWQSVQIVMMMKCHISNILASLRRCKDKHFSRHTIKTPRLSAHIYYIGLGATQPRGPNCTLQERL